MSVVSVQIDVVDMDAAPITQNSDVSVLKDLPVETVLEVSKLMSLSDIWEGSYMSAFKHVNFKFACRIMSQRQSMGRSL